MATADFTLRISYWYYLEETDAGWWTTPAFCMSGLGEPEYIKFPRHYGPSSKAEAIQVGDRFIERMEREERYDGK